MLRPPRLISPGTPDNLNAALDYELAQEKASTLGRLGRRLEAALAELASFDTLVRSFDDAGRREALVSEASAALWHLVIQREALGLRDSAALMRDYKVPAEVRNGMGVVRPAPPRDTA